MRIAVYNASNEYEIYNSTRIPPSVNSSGARVVDTRNIVSATLSIGLNKAGTLTMVIPRNHRYKNRILVGNNKIKVSDCPLIRTIYDNQSDWHGRLTRADITPTTYKVTYEGQLSWLNAVVMPPYSIGHRTIKSMLGYYIDVYNGRGGAQLDTEIDDDPVSYEPYVPPGEILPDDSYKYSRYQNNVYSTVYAELMANVIADRDYVIAFDGTSKIRVKVSRYSSESTYATIDDNVIQSASHSIDYANRATKIYGLGGYYLESNGGDDGRAYQSYAQSDVNRVMSYTDKIVRYPDSVTETGTVYNLVRKSWEDQFADTDSVSVVVKNTSRKYAVGQFYRVVHDKLDINDYYQMVSGSVDLINPTTASLGFGAVKTRITTKTGKYEVSNKVGVNIW